MFVQRIKWVSRDFTNVSRVLVTPDSRFYVSSNICCSILVYRMDTGDLVYRLRGHKKQIVSLTTTPNSQYIVSSDGEEAIIVWSLLTGERESTIALDPGQTVETLTLSSSGSLVIGGCSDGTLHLWYLITGEKACCLQGHRDRIVCVIATSDGRHIVSTSCDRTVRVWSMDTMKQVCVHVSRCGPRASHVALTHDDRTLFMPDPGSVLAVSMCDRRQPTGTYTYKGTMHPRRILVTPDDRYMISVDTTSLANVWSLSTGELLYSFVTRLEEPFYTMAIIGSDCIVSCEGNSTDGECVSIRSLSTGEEIQTALEFGGEDVRSVIATPDGQQFIVRGEDHIYFWSTPLYCARAELDDILRLLSVAQENEDGDEDDPNLIEMTTLSFLLESARLSMTN